MTIPKDPVDAALAGIAGQARTAAPKPAPFAVIRILAERRRAEAGARRLATLVAFASAVAPVVAALAWLVQPASGSTAPLVAVLLVSSLPPLAAGLGGLAHSRRVRAA